jgi:predicted ABC-type ATPase
MATLYVVAGPNGAGKSTLFEEIIPHGVEYINADEIARELRLKAGGVNVQDLANRETTQLFFNKIQERKDFALETNLADVETYKTFLEVKKLGYTLNVTFLSVVDTDICLERVALRVKQGGHNVHSDIVKHRYIIGLRLLNHYKNDVDVLTVLDNSTGDLLLQFVMHSGNVVRKGQVLAPWAIGLLAPEATQDKKLPDSVDEVRKLYKGSKDSGQSL